MKIYTKTGDDGTTYLRGARIFKSSPWIEVQGDLDELNAWIGMARSSHGSTDLKQIQDILLEIGAELATGRTRVISDDIERLEKSIDTMSLDLPPLKNFILPAGGVDAAPIHVARAVCRRLERNLVTLMEREDMADFGLVIPYINRLSDYLFVLARKVRGWDETWTSRIDK